MASKHQTILLHQVQEHLDIAFYLGSSYRMRINELKVHLKYVYVAAAIEEQARQN